MDESKEISDADLGAATRFYDALHQEDAPNIISRRALHAKVLAVAVEGNIGDWAVYIANCPGWNHDEEEIEVARHGDKCSYALAKVLFPNLKERYTERMYRNE